MYQYSISMSSGAGFADDDSPGMARLPSADSDEDIDPIEYERQARERQRALVEQAEERRKMWNSWAPDKKITHPKERAPTIVRVDTPEEAKAGSGSDREAGAASDDDNSDNFDESKRGDKLYMQFRNYALSGFMDSKRFVSLCYDSFLIPFDTVKPDFALADAKATFEEVLSQFYDPDIKMCREPVVSNCIPYDIFHGRIIPIVAKKKNQSIHEIICVISAAKASNRRYWSESDGPKQLLRRREALGNHDSGDEGDDSKEQEAKEDMLPSSLRK